MGAGELDISESRSRSRSRRGRRRRSRSRSRSRRRSRSRSRRRRSRSRSRRRRSRSRSRRRRQGASARDFFNADRGPPGGPALGGPGGGLSPEALGLGGGGGGGMLAPTPDQMGLGGGGGKKRGGRRRGGGGGGGGGGEAKRAQAMSSHLGEALNLNGQWYCDMPDGPKCPGAQFCLEIACYPGMDPLALSGRVATHRDGTFQTKGEYDVARQTVNLNLLYSEMPPNIQIGTMELTVYNRDPVCLEGQVRNPDGSSGQVRCGVGKPPVDPGKATMTDRDLGGADAPPAPSPPRGGGEHGEEPRPSGVCWTCSCGTRNSKDACWKCSKAKPGVNPLLSGGLLSGMGGLSSAAAGAAAAAKLAVMAASKGKKIA